MARWVSGQRLKCHVLKKNSLGGWWAVGLLLKTPSFQIDCVIVELRHDYGTVGQWSKIEGPWSEKN